MVRIIIRHHCISKILLKQSWNKVNQQNKQTNLSKHVTMKIVEVCSHEDVFFLWPWIEKGTWSPSSPSSSVFVFLLASTQQQQEAKKKQQKMQKPIMSIALPDISYQMRLQSTSKRKLCTTMACVFHVQTSALPMMSLAKKNSKINGEYEHC